MHTNEFLNHFTRHKKNSPADWHVQCPGHDDGANPDKFSLHVTAKDDRLLICCMAGCETAAVPGALGLKEADLFYDHAPAPAGRTRVAEQPAREPEPTVAPEPIATLEAFAALKRIPIELLAAEGWLDTRKGIAIPYRQRDGSPWRVRGRTSLRPGAGFVWDGQKERPMIGYGRHRLDEAIDKGDLLLVEGESDIDDESVERLKKINGTAVSARERIWQTVNGLRPASTAEFLAVMRFCADYGIGRPVPMKDDAVQRASVLFVSSRDYKPYDARANPEIDERSRQMNLENDRKLALEAAERAKPTVIEAESEPELEIVPEPPR
jgi:hypothetical protein